MKKNTKKSIKTKKKEEVKEEAYSLTFKGLLFVNLTSVDTTTSVDEQCQSILNGLELYLRRFYSKDGHPAIVFDLNENKWVITTVSSPKTESI
jgi:hypothetical protein